MSVTIPFGSKWESVTAAVTGAATATITGEILSCTSVVGESAKATRHVNLKPGETVKVSCFARRVSGADNTSGGILITTGSTKDRVRVTSAHWREYSASYSHSLTSAEGAFIALEFGVFTSDAGTVEFTKPRMEISVAQQGGLRTHACGLITLASGAPSVNTNFTSHGIRNLAYDAATKTLTVTMDKTSGAVYSSPLVFAAMTKDGNGIKLTPKPGGYSAAAGTIAVQFSDNTGVAVDIATLGTMYMWFKAEIH